MFVLFSGVALAQTPNTYAYEADISIKATDGVSSFATSLSGLGDIDGDGYSDLLVADSETGGFSGFNGVVRVYFGPYAMTRPSFIYFGTNHAELGKSIATGGDYNGDGAPDFIIGAPGANGGNGFALMYSGVDGALLDFWVGDQPTGLVSRVAFLGDVDGMPGDEAMISSGTLNETGSPETFVQSNEQQDPLFVFPGAYVAKAGRINIQDEIPDIAIGLHNASHGADEHAGHILYRKGDNGSLIQPDDVIGPFGDAGESLGGVIRFMGDVDNDGFGDIAASGVAFDLNRGRVRLISGAGPDHPTIRSIDGESEEDLFGYSIANIGDFDGDGVDDFAVGAPGTDHMLFGVQFINAGRVYLYSGATGVLLQTFTGNSSFDQFGKAVSAAGDFNGDGMLDLAVSAPGSGSPVDGTGIVYIFFLSHTSPADLNRDNIVNGDDLAMLLATWGSQCNLPSAPACPADITNDGVVNGADLAMLLTNWGT